MDTQLISSVSSFQSTVYPQNLTPHRRTNLLIKFKLLIFILFLSLWQTVSAQWSNVGPADQGYITALTIDPSTPSTLYAGLSNGGIFKSIDSGINWVHSSAGLNDALDSLSVQILLGGYSDLQIHAIAIDPITPTTLYVGIANAGVVKSTDGGANWNVINSGLISSNTIDVMTLTINPFTASILYAGTKGEGTFKSTDGGANWSSINTGLENLNVNTLTIDLASPNIIYAGTNGGIFKSTNDGGNWSASNTGLTDLNVRAISIDPSDPNTLYTATAGGIFKSIDAGSTWSTSNTGLSTIDVTSVTINQSNSSILYAGTSSGIFKSTDGGTSWSPSNTGLSDINIRALIIDSSTPSILYAGTNDGGVFKTINSGTDWSTHNTGLANYDIRAIAINPSNSSNLYAGAYRTGIFKSTDNGATWTNSSIGLTPGFYGDWVQTLAIDPVTPSTIYAGTYGGIYKSTDSGINWSQITGSLLISDQLDVQTIVIDPITPSILYAVIKDHAFDIIKSSDGGINWTTIDINIGFTNYINTLAIDPVTPTTLYAGAYGEAQTLNGILKSTDGGATWTPYMYISAYYLFSYTEVYNIAIDPVTPSTIYASTNHGIYKKTNSTSWSAGNIGLNNDDIYDITIDPITPSTLYASNHLNGGVFKSVNSAVSWTAMNDGLSNLNVATLAVDPSTHSVYAGTHANSVYKYAFDISPDELTYANQNNVALNTLIVSETLNITGINTNVDIIITGGEYSLNSSAFTSATGSVSNGDTLQLRTTSSASYNTTTNVVVTVGDGGDTWSVSTMADAVPDAFSFAEQNDVAFNTLTTSNTIVISGLGASSPISITGGEYKINSGAYTSTGGFVNNSDSVTLQTTSANDWFVAVDAVLSIGGVSDTFTVTTLDADSDGDGINNSIDTNDDNDGYLDANDNCTIVANDQTDTDGDGYGNACDGDFNNDNIVNSLDLGLFKTVFFTTGEQQTDLNGDNIVNSLDLGLFKQLFFTQPGPSGLVP